MITFFILMINPCSVIIDESGEDKLYILPLDFYTVMLVISKTGHFILFIYLFIFVCFVFPSLFYQGLTFTVLTYNLLGSLDFIYLFLISLFFKGY